MKFHGIVGFTDTNIETSPDVFEPGVIERKYSGDIINAVRRFDRSDHQNDTLRLNNRISILSDLYARQNWGSIIYVIWNGVKLKVESVTLDFPRITLEIGGVYNVENPVRVESNTP